MTLTVSQHAIDRYRERVSDVSNAEAIAALTSPTIIIASQIGAPFVRLPGRQRVVIKDMTVVTVLPADSGPRCMARSADLG